MSLSTDGSAGRRDGPWLTAMPVPGTETLQHRRLVDEVMVAYVDWREECIGVSDAYRGWAAAEPPETAFAFAVYVAALDREERASQVYAGLSLRVTADS